MIEVANCLPAYDDFHLQMAKNIRRTENKFTLHKKTRIKVTYTGKYFDPKGHFQLFSSFFFLLAIDFVVNQDTTAVFANDDFLSGFDI